MPFRPRPARSEDAEAIARIYNEGIEDRLATFETRHRSADDVRDWVDDGFPLVVVEDGETLVAWASAAPYRPGREAYAGIGEFSVYVARSERRRGYWKLVSRIFPENDASLALCRAVGFREVGVYRRHAKLDGEWRDVVVVELLLEA